MHVDDCCDRPSAKKCLHRADGPQVCVCDGVQDADRIDSGKAAVLSGAVGGLASVPYALSSSPSAAAVLISIASAGISAALFGIVYRYARRVDGAADVQLKSGAVTAFAVVRLLTAQEITVQLEGFAVPTLGYETLAPAALNALAQVFIFAFASVALEAAMSRGFSGTDTGGP